jgi:Di- and tricarboxylate transporters
MSAGLFSLLLLFAAIIIGFVRKINVGLVALFFALIICKISGIPEKNIIQGFNANLFITLMGVTLLFSILNSNGTIDIMAQKIVKCAGNNNYLIPIAVFFVGFIITTLGPGSIPVLAIMPAFAIPIALARGYNPLMLSLIGCFGIFSGRMSTVTPEGILVYSLLKKDNIEIANAVTPMYVNMIITGIVLFFIAFIYYKGFKIKRVTIANTEKVLKFNKLQFISLAGLIIMVSLVIFLKYNVGVVSFAVSAVLLSLKVSDEKKSINGIPWGVLLMISGVSSLMSMVIKTGGIKVLTIFLASMMTPYTAPAVMGATAGIMSWFSSGLGVVFPTLIPTVANVSNAVGGVNPIELASMVVVGGTVTGVSPISTTGGLIMATMMASNEKNDKKKELSLFIELFAWSVVALVVLVILALLGAYKIFL